jgi:hypothetical protein
VPGLHNSDKHRLTSMSSCISIKAARSRDAVLLLLSFSCKTTVGQNAQYSIIGFIFSVNRFWLGIIFIRCAFMNSD